MKMTKRSVALVGVLVVMAMIGSSVIGAVSAIAASDTANGSFSVFLPLILNAIGAMAEVPQGAVMTFNLASCPSGWTEVTDAQGRAIVGLPAGGTLAGTVGSGLSDLEDRSHTHDVNPANTSTTSSGNHIHTVNPGIQSTTLNGGHSHTLNPPVTLTSSRSLSFQWAEFDSNEFRWSSWDYWGDLTSIMNWGDGMDSAGDGHYPLSRSSVLTNQEYYTKSASHNHSVDIAPFDTESIAGHYHWLDLPQMDTSNTGAHSHSVDIPNTSSTTASTSDVMPYIQFLVCEKD
jgi:hypothetical protein